MAHVVLGRGTSHTPMLTLPADLWPAYASARPQPRAGLPARRPSDVLPGRARLRRPDVRARYRGPEAFHAQAEACQRALDELSRTLRGVKPDITIVIGDDQDEWFYEDNMPAFSVYWGETAPLIPRLAPVSTLDRAVAEAIIRGYGDIPLDVAVASRFGRFLIEYLIEHDFDVAHIRYAKQRTGNISGRIGNISANPR